VTRSRLGRRHGLAALQAGVSLVALGAVIWWATRQEAPSFPRTGEAAAALLAALGVYTAATLLRGERWHRILEHGGFAVGRGDAYRLTAVGYMGNNVLPARSGDLLRAFLLAPITGRRKRELLGTVVAERLLDAAALAVVFAAVALGLLSEAEIPGGRTVLFGAAGAGLLGLLGLAAVVLIKRANAFERVRAALRPFAAPSRALASGHGIALAVVSLAIWALEAGVYAATARAAGIELSPVEALYVVALTNLFALIPAAPGYVGTFDAAVLFAVGSLGEGGSDALAYLVLLRFVLFVPITLVGLVFLVTRYGGWSRFRAARLETPG
jgi:uncharacterized membrane protein YbhN (UPF0104 family)